jgi:sulfopyruvate decarboxylase subunit beta
MLGSMGLASSIGLGLALSTDRKVVVIDGDGALLMNLGSLATIGATGPRNYVLIVIDNQSYGSTGFQPTFTGSGVRLDRIAQACSIEQALWCDRHEDVKPLVKRLVEAAPGPSVLVIGTEKGVPDNVAVIPHDAVWLRDRFMRSVQNTTDNQETEL